MTTTMPPYDLSPVELRDKFATLKARWAKARKDDADALSDYDAALLRRDATRDRVAREMQAVIDLHNVDLRQADAELLSAKIATRAAARRLHETAGDLIEVEHAMILRSLR